MSDPSGWFDHGSTVGAQRQRRHVRRRRAPRRLLWFRSVELNALGWLALIGSGTAVSAAIGAITNLATSVSAVIGFTAVYTAARAVDWHHWRHLTFGLADSRLAADQARAIVDQLRAKGHDVSLECTPQEVSADDEPIEWIIRSTNRHRKVIETAMARAVGTSRPWP